MNPSRVDRRHQLSFLSIVGKWTGFVGLGACCVLIASGVMSIEEAAVPAQVFSFIFGSGSAGKLLAIEELWVATSASNR